MSRIDRAASAVRTMTATVELAPAAGSRYSGVIKQYHDVRAFILFAEPARIRMVGQAPVVRTTLFDMVSDGKSFKLSIPPKNKFIVGPVRLSRRSKNPIENLRPQHILDALRVRGVESGKDLYFTDQQQDGARWCDVVHILERVRRAELRLARAIWLDGTNFDMVRLQLYDSAGQMVEDVRYTMYQNFNGVEYPSRIAIDRPLDDYQLAITIQKAVFNQPIPPARFELAKPAGAELVDLGANGSAGGRGGH